MLVIYTDNCKCVKGMRVGESYDYTIELPALEKFYPEWEAAEAPPTSVFLMDKGAAMGRVVEMVHCDDEMIIYQDRIDQCRVTVTY